MHERYQLGRAQENIKNLEAYNLGISYLVLKNECSYWENDYKGADVGIAERYVVIKKPLSSLL